MYLFFDTETTGLPRNWRAPVTDTANWPRLVQLAWMQSDRTGTLIDSGSSIIKPEGFTIPTQASAVHGITTDRALREGEPLADVLEKFVAAVEQSRVLVAHNIGFDLNIVGAELHRSGLSSRLFELPALCTMQSATEFCAIPSPYGHKWPKLEELYEKLFHTRHTDAHSATSDVAACARCFFELQRIGVITP